MIRMGMPAIWNSILSCNSVSFLLLFRSEEGTYYALHLGGTYFRMLTVKLGGQRSSILVLDVKRQLIPQHLMTGTTEVG